MATDPYELTEIPKREEVMAADQAGRPLVFKWFIPPSGEEIAESLVLMTAVTTSGDSSDVLLIAGNDLNVKHGPDLVTVRIDYRTDKGEIIYV